MGLIELGGIAALGGAIGLYPGIEHLLTFKKIERKWNPPEAVEFLSEHVSKAKRSVDIVSDELNPFVFNPLAPLISHQLEIKPRLTVRLIISPHIAGLKSSPSGHSENRLYDLAMTERFGDRLQIKVAKNFQEPQFGVIDTTHLYIEKAYNSESLTQDVTIYKNSGFTAAEFQSRFEEMWEAAETILPHQITVISHKLEATNPEEARRIIKEVEALPILQGLETG